MLGVLYELLGELTYLSFFTLDSGSALQEQTEAYNAAKGRCVLYVLKRWEGLERVLSLVLSLSVVEDPTAD